MDSHMKDWIIKAIKEGYVFYGDDKETPLEDTESILTALDRPLGIWVQSPIRRLKIELPNLEQPQVDYIG